MKWQKVSESSIRRVIKMCAFCEHWYDPANSYIEYTGGNWWRYDIEAKCRCKEQRGILRKANQFCSKYKCKI